MRKLSALSLLYLITLFCSCSKKNDAAPAGLIGKWNVYQEHVQVYNNNVARLDTTFKASADFVAYIQFNTDKTYATHSDVYSELSGTRVLSATSTTQGTYVYNNGNLTLSQTTPNVVVSGNTSGQASAQVSSTVQIKQLEANQLILYFDNKVSTSTQTVEDIATVTYTR